MQYLVLLAGDETTEPQPGSPEFDADIAAFGAFDELAGDAVVGGYALWGNDQCRTVQVVGDTVQVTDGPFAETVEGLGGYYVLEAETLDDAIELARHIPSTARGATEIRPLVQYTDAAAERGPTAEGEAMYLATIHGPATDADDPASDAWSAGAHEHGAFVEAHRDVVVGGGAVHPASMATTIRVRDGELVVTDGPYSELAEIVGGFYVLRSTAERAAEVAARIPRNDGGWVLLRPIMELDG